jgi:zeta-carotene desaturase
VRAGVSVSRIVIGDGRVEGLFTSDGQTLTADAYISALPWQALRQTLPPACVARDAWFGRLAQLRSSPIISINLWFDRPVTSIEFAALLTTQTQWLFNKQRLFAASGTPAGYLSLVISGAHDLIERSSEELTAMAVGELRRLVPTARSARLRHAHVIKERHATLSDAVDVTPHRLSQETPLPNFFLAGDWTASALPATIESAVASGHHCAAQTGKLLARQSVAE